MFTRPQIARLNADFEEALRTVFPGRPANTNEEPLPEDLDATVFGQNTRRLGNLLNASPGFLEEVITNDTLHAVCAEVFREMGDYWLSTAQMIDLGPGSKAQPLHADGAGWWPFWTMAVREEEEVTFTPEFMLNFLIATTDTTVANGATGVVKNSHKIKYSAEALKDAAVQVWDFPDEEVEQVELEPGDCLLLGGRIVHRGGENRTKSERRGVLSCTVVSASLTPDEAHPLVMDERTRNAVENLDERAKKFVGLRDMRTALRTGVWQDFRPGGLKKTMELRRPGDNSSRTCSR